MVSMTRVHQSPGSWAGEISNIAPSGDFIYWLYARSLDIKPFFKVNVHTQVVSEAYMPPYPLTNWFFARHGNKIIFPGQAYTENVYIEPCNPSSIGTVVMFENGVPSFHIIHPHTDNVTELIGCCYHNGQWKTGERSGCIPGDDPYPPINPTTSKYKKCAEYKTGGGIWVSNDGEVWHWSGFQDPMMPNLGYPIGQPSWNLPYARECYLAVLNGKLYAFMHGGTVPDRVPTSVYEVHGNYSTTHMGDTPDINIGLVPYPFNPDDENNQFSWKGAIIMWCSYPALTVFSPSLSPPLQFWNISVDGVPVNNAGASPVGIYEGKLLIATVIGDRYAICEASELFGPVRRITDWALGDFSPKGMVYNNKLWVAVRVRRGLCAVDVLSLEEISISTLTFIVRDEAGNPIPIARVVVE